MEYYFFLTSAAELTPWENKFAHYLKSHVLPALQTSLGIRVRLHCGFDQSCANLQDRCQTHF